ncbi:MAG: nucleotidyl transferase AbiEii/AbiGii toxin family protein [Flavipsychrobacter sp.]|jgi:predicted nucleotidyltransferase component of viral defense system|nr:nucleotidyl transferase AbiEii/AbiGii toxin family protein [Flavipsychrobacter sp.]
MAGSLHWNTVTPLLRSGLEQLMAEPLFDEFRLVGGTSLSLQMGHRMSIDIDLFTDAEYGSIDFHKIDSYLRNTFPYVSPAKLLEPVAMGTSYIFGVTAEESIKLDIYYTDSFIFPMLNIEGIRLASKEEIIAMKIEVVQRGGRKKDFWDLHALLDEYTIQQMIEMHEKRYPYSHDRALIEHNVIDFISADKDFDPVCLLGKQWEVIKLDIIELYGNKQ